MDSTVLIIGAGTFGVSTAWHLSQNHNDPSKVTIIDRENSPPSRSAAADINRILTADFASPLYANLAKEALSFWAEDPDLEWYFHKVGRLVLEEEGEYISRRGVQLPGDGRIQNVDLDQLRKRWEVLDGTDMRAIRRAYLESDAGWADAATATWQFLETAIRRRVKRAVGDVTELLFDESDKRITGARTADGREFLAETVILAAGAWTSALLSPVEDALNIADEDRIERQAQATATISAYYPVSVEGLKRMAGCKMPCVIYGQVGEVVPATRDNKLLKFTSLKTRIVNMERTRSGREISVPPAKPSDDVPQEHKVSMGTMLTQRLLPRFASGRPKWRMCWDNRTPTEDLLLCKHPQIKNLFIITGGSFQGYIFMPNIGKYMINILKRESNGRDVDKAFGWKSKAEVEAVGRADMERKGSNKVNTGSRSKL